MLTHNNVWAMSSHWCACNHVLYKSWSWYFMLSQWFFSYLFAHLTWIPSFLSPLSRHKYPKEKLLCFFAVKWRFWVETYFLVIFHYATSVTLVGRWRALVEVGRGCEEERRKSDITFFLLQPRLCDYVLLPKEVVQHCVCVCVCVCVNSDLRVWNI